MATIVSHKYRYIFVHVPRTAGSSLQSALRQAENDLLKSKIIWRAFMLMGSNKQSVHAFKMQQKHITARTFAAMTGHPKACDLYDALPGGIFRDYFKFAVVRNPWDWCVSRYEYRRKLGHEGQREFKGYLELITETPGSRQWDHLSDGSDTLLIDHAVKFEELSEELPKALARCGLEISAEDIPHVNQSQRGKYQQYYDDDTRQIVLEYFRKDVEEFGYEF